MAGRSHSKALRAGALEMTTTLEPPEGTPMHDPHDKLEVIAVRRRCAEELEESSRVANVDPVQEARVEVHVQVQARIESNHLATRGSAPSDDVSTSPRRRWRVPRAETSSRSAWTTRA